MVKRDIYGDEGSTFAVRDLGYMDGISIDEMILFISESGSGI